MNEKFQKLLSQLKDLAQVVNNFKSEAVQVKVIEMFFQSDIFDLQDSQSLESGRGETKATTVRRHKKVSGAKEASVSDNKIGKKKSKKFGAQTAVNALISDGFFKTKKTIGNIVAESSKRFARNFKPNEFSGKLARLVRSGELKRDTNKDGQYEYYKQ